MKLERIGLVVNPNAGGGLGSRFAGEAIRALAPRELFVGAGEMGENAVSGQSTALRTFDWRPHTGRARTAYLVNRFAAEGADSLIIVGGDGTLADAAFALYRSGTTIPLLGIGTGSANVGPLITCRGTEARTLAGAALAVRAVNGLIVGVDDVPLGLGFNDVVLGFTVLATMNGQVVDVDAAQKMSGRNIPRDPEPIGTPATCVVKIASRGETEVAQGETVATIVVGLPDERFYGKAIAGGVLLSGLVGDPAGCLVCDHLLVRMRMDADAYRRSEPVVSRYAGLNETERIECWGLKPGTVLCADGNPHAVLQPENRVQVRVQRALAHVVQIQPNPGAQESP